MGVTSTPPTPPHLAPEGREALMYKGIDFFSNPASQKTKVGLVSLVLGVAVAATALIVANVAMLALSSILGPVGLGIVSVVVLGGAFILPFCLMHIGVNYVAEKVKEHYNPQEHYFFLAEKIHEKEGHTEARAHFEERMSPKFYELKGSIRARKQAGNPRDNTIRLIEWVRDEYQKEFERHHGRTMNPELCRRFELSREYLYRCVIRDFGRIPKKAKYRETFWNASPIE